VKRDEVISVLKNKLNFSDQSVHKLILFHSELLKANGRYNLISSSTELTAWNRHILDSAQLVSYVDFEDNKTLCDLGTGAGFPGLVISIFNNNSKFHVKLYEKSPVKCDFLEKMIKLLNLDCKVIRTSYIDEPKAVDYVVARAFKKFTEVLRISREIGKDNHILIVLKGKNAQFEIDNALNYYKFSYTLKKSITEIDSKIVIVENIE
tara:strand:+ start:428 stop:1048 length:621 start_codon:yes stop_codon:yes gene_type:complete